MGLVRIIFFLGIFSLLLGCGKQTSSKGDPLDFVPENSSVVFKVSNETNNRKGFETLRRDLGSNSLFSALGETNPYNFFVTQAGVLKYINPSSQSLLCLNTDEQGEAVFTFITQEAPNLFVLDSLKDKIVETLTYKQMSIQRVSIDNQITYTAVKDSVFIASSSQQVLQAILEGKTEKDATFQKIAAIKNSNQLTALVRSSQIPLSDSTRINFASWTSIELEVLPNSIVGTGITLARDENPQLLAIFEGLLPRQNEIAKIIPTDAMGAVIFTYNDASLLYRNLQKFRGSENGEQTPDPLFESVNEIGTIQLQQGRAVILKSIDPILTRESLLPYISADTQFQEVDINTFSAAHLFSDNLEPLVSGVNPGFSFELGSFFVFTESQSDSEQMIRAFKNDRSLNKLSYFEEATSQLGTSSSLLIYRLRDGLPAVLANFFRGETAEQLKNISLENYPFTAVQFTYDRDFAHVNFVCTEANSEAIRTDGIIQQFNLVLDQQVYQQPYFFSNHNTGGKDIVVQDISSKLYLISENGKINWTKNLTTPILGEIHEVDILRNGKKQLAFVTKNAFHVVDRNGNAVAPFPIKFKDDITQPLAVFDYDNNRKYRFLVTQGKEVLMYNSEGNIVKGFSFKKAESNLVLSPKHIRLASKDYILIAQENGKLLVLNRIGKSQFTVSKKFEFAEIPITSEGNDFVVITANNTKEGISRTGKVTSQQLDISSSYYFIMNGVTKVTMDDNLLRINGKLAELPFGMYTPPKIFKLNKQTYITVTETQEGKVYLFDEAASLIPGFPAYGTSSIDLGIATNKEGDLMVVRGAEKEVLLYKLQ